MNRNEGQTQVQVYGNSQLEAEKSRTFDFGLEAEKGRSTGRLTYFHNKVDNLIDAQLPSNAPVGCTLYFQYANIKQAVMDGVEGEYAYRFDKHWDAKLNFTYLDARDGSTDARLTDRPG